MRKVILLVCACCMMQSCIFGGERAEEEIKKLQEKLDKIRYNAEEFSSTLDENMDSTEYERIQNFLLEIEEESTYSEYDFYVPYD